MQQRVTRQELYDLAWSEPMRTLAKRFGISDVALVKTCRQMHVPTPPQGYWNKKAAGKPTLRLKLPPRPVGLDNTVVLAGGRYARYYQHSLSQEEILGSVPPAPAFDETMEDVRKRLDAMLLKVAVQKDSGLSPPAVAKLLKRDDDKREKQKGRSYIQRGTRPSMTPRASEGACDCCQQSSLPLPGKDAGPTHGADIHMTALRTTLPSSWDTRPSGLKR